MSVLDKLASPVLAASLRHWSAEEAADAGYFVACRKGHAALPCVHQHAIAVMALEEMARDYDPLEEQEITVGTFDRLKAAGLKYVLSVRGSSDVALQSIPGIGKKRLRELREVIGGPVVEFR
jgi:hypothetical protein